MVKILLKKQFTEIFRTYFYNQKTNKKRSLKTTVLYFVLFAFLLIAVFGGMFGFVAYMICPPFCSLNLGWMYFVIMGLIAIALGAFGSIFNTYSGLYLAKDNDFLLSLPIPVSAIMTSRLLGVYLMGLMYSGFVSLSAIIIYLCTVGFSIKALICGFIFAFIISILVLVLSCLLGWVVAKVSLKLKNKSFVTVLVSLLGIGLYYFCYFKAQSVISNLIENALIYGQKIKGSAYFLYAFGRIGEGSLPATLGGLLATGALFALTWFLLQRSFLKIATTTGALHSKARKSTKSVLHVRTVRAALFSKEMSRFTSSAGYMLNCSLGTLFLLILCLTLALKADLFQLALSQMGLSSDLGYGVALCIICVVAGMNDCATPSISLEGKNLWVLQTLPIKAWEVLKAKLFVQLLVTAVPSALCVIVLLFALKLSALQFLLALLFVMGFVLMMALFDLFVGLKLPNLNWTNELVPIKQSFGVMLALFGAWIFLGIMVVLYLFFGKGLSVFLYVSIFTVVCWILSLILALWLKKTGTKVFEAL